MTRTHDERAERAIVLQLLRDDHPPTWSRAELERQVSSLDALTVSDALATLGYEGVVILTGEQVQASPCARHLDTLELIGI